MSDIATILKDWGNETVGIIHTNMRRAGKNATGQTRREIKSESTDTRVTVTGPSHVFTLETGRGPYNDGPESNLKGKIAEWMRAKPVTPKNGQTIEQAAKSIAWFINKFGTQLYRNGGRKDIITPAISDERIERLLSDIANVEQDTTIKAIEKYG